MLTTGTERVRRGAGETGCRLVGLRFLPGADRFFPPGVTLIGLDYSVLHGHPQLGSAALPAPLRAIAARRPVIPVVWAQHDDGRYIGRPFTPLPEFATKLADAKAAGFGIIHWTTRPLDLYFTSLGRQVWQRTKDEPLRPTCDHMAARRWAMRGSANICTAGSPSALFARETGDYFIDRPLREHPRRRGRLPRAAGVARLGGQRPGQLLQGTGTVHRRVLRDARLVPASQAALGKNDVALARQLMAQCRPEPVIEQFAKFSSLGGITRGEQGLVVSMNTRWLTHIVRHRQALGLEPVRIKFGPTQHDPLAQMPRPVHVPFRRRSEVWQVLGEEETGARVFTAPAASEDIARTGIQSDRPFSFTLRPDHPYKREVAAARQLPVAPAIARSRLDRSRSTRVYSCAGAASDTVDIFKEAGGANRLLERVYPVALRAAPARSSSHSRLS